MSIPKNIVQIKISKIDDGEETNNFKNISEVFNLNEYNYILFTNDLIKEFISSHGDYDILEAYNCIEPYAFKADIAKYYIINKIGGIYIDSNIFISKNVESFFLNELFFYDSAKEAQGPKPVVSGFFCSDKDNYILNLAVKEIVLNIKNKLYGKTPLDVSGPTMLGKIGINYFPKKRLGSFGFIKDTPNKRFYIGDAEVAQYKPNGLLPADSGIVGGNNYIDIWNNRNVYGEHQ